MKEVKTEIDPLTLILLVFVIVVIVILIVVFLGPAVMVAPFAYANTAPLDTSLSNIQTLVHTPSLTTAVAS